MTKILSLFIILFSFIKGEYRILKPEEFYNKVKGVKKGEEFYKGIIINLKKILNYFVYIDLVKNPPQPDFNYSYFEKVDTMKYLDKIKITNETNSYDFFRSIRILIDSYHDAHMSYGLKGFDYVKYIFLSPIKFKTLKDENGIPYMSGYLSISEENKNWFKNGEKIFMTIFLNQGEKIKKINGKDPFDYIQTFGEPFMSLKNSHATYTHKFHQFGSPFALYFPFNYDDIKNFTIEYENGDFFETDFAIAEIVTKSSNNEKFFKFYKESNIEKKFMDFFEKKFSDDNNDNLNLNFYDLINDFEKSFNNNYYNNLKYIDSKNLITNNLFINKNNENGLKWDYEYIQNGVSLFQCRVDKENEVNVYHLRSYGYSDLDKAFLVLENCTSLFDLNKFPIIIIQNYNGGGSMIFSHTMLEYIQPHITKRMYSTFRQGEYLNKYYDLGFQDHFQVNDCKNPAKESLLKNTIEIDYYNVKNYITQPFIRFSQYRDKLDIKKLLLNNKRKPTDIIVFTDSYSASAASFFCKTLQNEGGAILVGYMGNPKLVNIPFDSSQHFSSTITKKELETIDPGTTSKLENYGIYFTQMCITNNYLNYIGLELPEEYNIRKVDERSEIYQVYDEENNYDLFIKEGLRIHKKYKTECNVQNKKLTLFSESCKFSDKNTHGGYACGEHWEWNKTECIPVYCDIGYYFDYNFKKCRKDPCKYRDNKTNKGSYLKYIFVNIMLILIIYI